MLSSATFDWRVTMDVGKLAEFGWVYSYNYKYYLLNGYVWDLVGWTGISEHLSAQY